MKWIDTPPVWLALFLALAWLQSRFLPTPFPQAMAEDVGALTILCGIVLLIAAARQFRRHGTTILPHGEASALITTGVFRRTRNPIYLADLLLLIGFSLWWGSVLGLVLVPGFVLLLNRRFIEREEHRLRAAFGAEFDAYAQETRRWI